jgi:hypothetical protein
LGRVSGVEPAHGFLSFLIWAVLVGSGLEAYTVSRMEVMDKDKFKRKTRSLMQQLQDD